MQYKDKLPERWAILRTPDNYKMVNEWANKIRETNLYTNKNDYIHSVGQLGGDLYNTSKAEDCKEITTEEFKYLVLGQKLSVTDLKENDRIHVTTIEEDKAIRKLCHEAGMTWNGGTNLLQTSRWDTHRENTILWPIDGVAYGPIQSVGKDITIYPASWFINNNTSTMEKEIVGYVLKPECQKYRCAVSAILEKNQGLPDHLTNVNKDGTNFVIGSVYCTWLEEAGVLQLWFNPVYKKEEPNYKVGDYVTVEKENSCNTYRRGETFKIEKLFNSDKTHCRKENTSIGISLINVRPATTEEIANAQVETIQMAEGFQLTIKDKKVFHGSEDITSYVRGINTWINGTNCIGSKPWPVTVKEVIFSITGCQQKETKLSQWLSIYDKIK